MRRQWRSLFGIHGLQPQVMEPQCAEPGPLGDRSCRLRLQYGSLPRQRVSTVLVRSARVRFYTNNGIANFPNSLDLDFTPQHLLLGPDLRTNIPDFESLYSKEWLKISCFMNQEVSRVPRVFSSVSFESWYTRYHQKNKLFWTKGIKLHAAESQVQQ